MNIIPLRSKIPLNKDVFEKYKDIQLIDSRLVAGIEHIEFAYAQAKKAFRHNENISKDPLIEILVRMSGQRQIKIALEMFGLNDSKDVILISKKDPKNFLSSDGLEPDDSVLKIDLKKFERIKKSFDIGEIELEAVYDIDRETALIEIVKERVALVSIR